MVKRIDYKYQFILEAANNETVNVKYVFKNQIPADYFTMPVQKQYIFFVVRFVIQNKYNLRRCVKLLSALVLLVQIHKL